MEIDRSEVLRYLGYHGQTVDEVTEELVESCEKELMTAVRFRFLMREYPLTLGEGGIVDITCFQTVSKNLSRNLTGCEKILLMAATLGTEVDRLLARYGKYQVSRAVVLQAAATAFIEDCCDGLCAGWKEDYKEQGLYLRPRFSPGYGDFSIACQGLVLDALEAGKRIGITLTDSSLMLPSKSVTAVIGLGKQPLLCELKGCELCSRTDCAYRR